MSLTIQAQAASPIPNSTFLHAFSHSQLMASASQATGNESSIKSLPVISKLGPGNPLTEFLKNWLPWAESILQTFGLKNPALKRLGLVGSVLGIVWNAYDALLAQGKIQALWRLLSLGLAAKLSYYSTGKVQSWATEKFQFLKNKPGEIAAGVVTLLAFQWLLNIVDQKLLPQLKRTFNII